MLILGIETSCDETSVALVEANRSKIVVRKNLVHSQIAIHKKYGGVVPEVAARHHVEKIALLIGKILKWGHPKIIAVTSGPGLATALLVGVETARTISYLLKIPLVSINHIEGHIYANWLPPPRHSGLEPESRRQKLLDSRLHGNDNKKFPILCLIVSGGHTELILMTDHLKYKLIGQTRDDAAGECFDKVGKILGLPYPGGPRVAKLAEKGNPQAIQFPRPMIDSPDFDFSFSGLKTSVLYHLQKTPKLIQYDHKAAADICASFQQAAIDVLIAKTVKAAKKYKIKTILTGGGVAANYELQKQLGKALKENAPQISLTPINLKFCGDNAAMIAAAGYFHSLKKDYVPWQQLSIDPNWELV